MQLLVRAALRLLAPTQAVAPALSCRQHFVLPLELPAGSKRVVVSWAMHIVEQWMACARRRC